MIFDSDQLADIAGVFGLRLIVLFGSRATGSPPPGPDSDFDVAVLGCQTQDFWSCYQSLAGVFAGGQLDLVRLEEADPLFRHEIMHGGVRLYGDPDLFCDYRAYVYRDYVDSADLRALEQTLFRKKMAYLESQLEAHDDPV